MPRGHISWDSPPLRSTVPTPLFYDPSKIFIICPCFWAPGPFPKHRLSLTFLPWQAS